MNAPGAIPAPRNSATVAPTAAVSSSRDQPARRADGRISASAAVLGNCRACAQHYLRCALFWGGLGVEEMSADLRGRSDHVLRKYAPILGLVVYLALIAVVGLIAMLTGAR